jgi:predicted HTH transcriptional regulator
MAGFDDFITAGRESRALDYKGPRTWDVNRSSVIKTSLAMANLRDGGVIVVGVEEATADPGVRVYETPGLSPEQQQTYDEETIRAAINAFADPHISIDAHHYTFDSKQFVLITVSEFDTVPIVTRRGGGDIRRGAIYTRTTKPENVEVPDSAHMREILDLAMEKALERQGRALSRLGVSLPEIVRLSDDEAFERQRGSL